LQAQNGGLVKPSREERSGVTEQLLMAVDSSALGNKSEPEPQQGHEAKQLPAVDLRAAAAGESRYVCVKNQVARQLAPPSVTFS
jgi:hypothetical protein